MLIAEEYPAEVLDTRGDNLGPLKGKRSEHSIRNRM
jgi:hypothetical protein